MNKTPLSLFTFNRPRYTRRALEALSRCARLDECYLNVYCDGAKNAGQTAAVEATRQVVHDWALQLKARVIEQTQNLGVDVSIINGVTELCREFGRVIVLEDDFIISRDFISYMIEGLDHYQAESKVFQISGYMYPSIKNPPEPDTFFLPMTTSRGWATWERAWNIFDWNATGYKEKLANGSFRRLFNLDDCFDYASELELWMSKPFGPWDIRFYYSVFNQAGLVLYPRKSLVWLGGWDLSGTHCGPNPDFLQSPRIAFKNSRLSNPIIFPNEVAVDQDALARLKLLLKAQPEKRKTPLERFFRKIHYYSTRLDHLTHKFYCLCLI